MKPQIAALVPMRHHSERVPEKYRELNRQAFQVGREAAGGKTDD